MDVDGVQYSNFSPEKLLPLLKEELEKAKAAKDHKKAGKLRNQIWIVTDLSHGVQTAIPKADLIPILQNLPGFNQDKPAVKKTSTVAVEDKQLKALRKKLKQIEDIKAKQAKGEKLQPQQVTKLETEDQLKAEIKELEELTQNLMCSKPAS
ncbi:hypothetical protein CAPTEDRAFT_206605 [Capitella teleta]|uniref:Uncharacterized protein n=1 Tax=Capitella teleta TaxID=283909 RepID=R7T501_CAPTE|nr:hypothetical protein CAPTEDRAFT_206605 [Capitella teleta]|eukprot:ELT88083.1 hypothetical protein CAPTEDRAFT_206605 [Capitella teleta]